MSISLLKRLLLLFNVLALVALGAAGYRYFQHRKTMEAAWRPPNFEPDVRQIGPKVIRIEHINAALGRFPKKVEKKAEAKKEEPKRELESVLARLGEIKTAIVVYPPYGGNIRPALIFETKDGKKRILRLNEAIEGRRNPKYYQDIIPVHYQFIGCEPDPDNPGATYFLFDMNCDGKDIQKAHWIGEKRKTPNMTDGERLTAGPINSKKALIGISEEELRASTKPKKTTGDASKPVEPGGKAIDRGPPKEGPIMTRAEPEVIFEEQAGGVFATTRESHEYLTKNYNKLLKDAQTRVYRDPKTGRPKGLRVLRIARGSKANAFGIRSDDIILSINDRVVTDRKRAVIVVKKLLKEGAKVLKVKIKRQGRVFDKRFDTRDPDTRAALRKYK